MIIDKIEKIIYIIRNNLNSLKFKYNKFNKNMKIKEKPYSNNFSFKKNKIRQKYNKQIKKISIKLMKWRRNHYSYSRK